MACLSKLAGIVFNRAGCRLRRPQRDAAITHDVGWILDGRFLPGAGINAAFDLPLDRLIEQAVPIGEVGRADNTSPLAGLFDLTSNPQKRSASPYRMSQVYSMDAASLPLGFTSEGQTANPDSGTTTVLAFLDQAGTTDSSANYLGHDIPIESFGYLFGGAMDASTYNWPDGTWAGTTSSQFVADTPTAEQSPGSGPPGPTFDFSWADSVNFTPTTTDGSPAHGAIGLDHNLDSTYTFYDCIVDPNTGVASRQNLVDHPYTQDSALSIIFIPPSSRQFAASFTLTIVSDQLNFTVSITDMNGFISESPPDSFQRSLDGTTYSFSAMAHNDSSTATNDHIQIHSHLDIDAYNVTQGGEAGSIWNFAETTT